MPHFFSYETVSSEVLRARPKTPPVLEPPLIINISNPESIRKRFSGVFETAFFGISP
jgi:hypothetical protein